MLNFDKAKQELARSLGVDPARIVPHTHDPEDFYGIRPEDLDGAVTLSVVGDEGNSVWLVATEEQADKIAALCVFATLGDDPSGRLTNIPDGLTRIHFQQYYEHLQRLGGTLAAEGVDMEDLNLCIASMLNHSFFGGFDGYAEWVLEAEGRGHYIAGAVDCDERRLGGEPMLLAYQIG